MNQRNWKPRQRNERKTLSGSRLFVVLSGMLVLAAFIVARLVTVQLMEHESFTRYADRQYRNSRQIEPMRGMIYDRRGEVLVANLPYSYSIGLHPSLLENRDAAVHHLSGLLDMPASSVRSRMNQSAQFVWLQRKVDRQLADRVRTWGGRAVEVRRETRRDYPYQTTGGQVVGFVDIDNIGRNGIEREFEEILSGEPGWEILQSDGRRRAIVDPSYPRQDPVNGGSVVLSIDIEVQAIAEEELRRAVERHNAASGSIIVTRPATGELLALASVPLYDPNNAGEFDPSARKNRVVTDIFEPGSVLKVVSFCGLLESGELNLGEMVNCENGRFRVADRTIRDSHPYEYLSAEDVLVYSSNIGTIKLAERLSDREFYTLLRDFGFDQRTGIELPGEASGLLPVPSDWSGVSHANISIGQGISITALQLAMAYGAIANDGMLLRPMLVLSTTSPEGVTETHEPSIVRYVMRPGTARALRMLLEQVVERGTGRNAALDGISVAGKTGTAQRVDVENHCYYNDRYTSTFVGFLPADRPEYLAVVVIDDPKQNGHYGGEVAAPVFQRVMERMLVTLPLREPLYVTGENEENGSDNTADIDLQVPELVALTRTEAERELAIRNLEVSWEGAGEVVTIQSIPPGTGVEVGTTVRLTLGPCIAPSGDVEMPDLRGMDLREAVAVLSRLGLRARVEGSGLIISQWPEPGREVAVGGACTIQAITRFGGSL